MIIVSAGSFDITMTSNEYAENSIEKQLLNIMYISNETYQYYYLGQLKFELNLRKEIVNAAIALNNSKFSFAGFHNSRCNPEFWHRTDNGGFMLKEGSKPSEAINDIFVNGNKYATECATAIMIIYYKGLLNVYGDELFNKQFYKIYLMDWVVTEPLLKEVKVLKIVADILLGDRGYFINPDVNPATPEWQGENVIVLPNLIYFGHGVGIMTADKIISALNFNRKEGATQSAYLSDSFGRPNFKKLADVLNRHTSQTAPLVWRPFPAPIST